MAWSLDANIADAMPTAEHQLHVALDNLIDAQPLGELSLKGFHRPVLAYNVLGLKVA